MKNVLLLKIYECSLHINPSFQFLSSIRPKSRSLYTLLPPTRTVHTYGGGGGVNCRQSARIQQPAFSCDLAFSHMLHMPVSPPNSRFQAFSPQLTHLHRKKGEGGMLLHYTKQLGKFGFLHTCSPVTELLAKTPFYISSPGQLSNPPVTPPKILCEKGGGAVLF